MDWISSLLLATVRLAIPLLLISLAELYGQRAGMVNIGLEGLAAIGALVGFLACYITGSNWLGLLCGTLAGLVAGRKALGVGPEITGVAVSRKDAGYEGRCAELANASLEWLGSETRVTAADFDVERGYLEPGYEQPNEAANEAIRLLARTEGLLTDPVYTGKALAGLIGHVREGRIAPGETVIFWHTGGATALFAEQAILGDLAKK